MSSSGPERRLDKVATDFPTVEMHLNPVSSGTVAQMPWNVNRGTEICDNLKHTEIAKSKFSVLELSDENVRDSRRSGHTANND
jgi:hypothetical protein